MQARSRLTTQGCDPERSKYNLPLSAIRILYALREDPEELKASEVAKIILVRLSRVTSLSNRLEKRGYILRRKDTLDRRANNLEITTSGYTLFCEIILLY